ncbi:MAG: dihydrodipicolinate synthase family protein [Bacteroidota bacterium]
MQASTHLLKGVLTANLTPLKADLSVDHEKLVEHCHWLLGHGSDAIAVLGTTGEANSFTVDERMTALESLIKGGIPADKIMLGTGCCAFPDTVKLSKHALSHGVKDLLLLPPFYYKATDEGLKEYFKLLLERIDNPEVRLYLYHIPQMSGISFSIELTKELASIYPNNIVGMKDSSGNWEHMSGIVKEIPGFQMFAGTEKFLLDILKVGGVGCISATANATSARAQEVYQAFVEGKDADGLQDALTAVRKSFEGFVFVSALKAKFSDWQGNTNWEHMRAPNVPLSAEDKAALNARLEAVDFSL